MLPQSGTGRGWWIYVIVVLTALVVPALGVSPGSADLAVPGPVRFEGNVTWSAPGGLVYLEHDEPAHVPFVLTPAKAVVHVWTWEGVAVATPFVKVRSDPTFNETTETIPELLAMDIFAAPGAAVSLETQGDARLATTGAEAVRAHIAHVSVDPAYRFRVEHDGFIPYSYHYDDVLAVRTNGTQHLDARGTVTIALWNSTLRAQTEDGVRIYHAGQSRDATGAAHTSAESRTKQVVWLEIAATHLTGTWAGHALALHRQPTLEASGTTLFPGATGEVRSEGLRAVAHQHEVQVFGNLTLLSQPGGGAPAVVQQSDVAVHAYEKSRWALNGDLDAVRIAGVPALIPDADGLDAASVALSATGALAAIAALRIGAPMLVGRIGGRGVLANRTRARLYQAVCAEPGLHATELARRTGINPSTAIYHLRVLRTNGRVSFLRDGKHYRYFENHGKWDGQRGLVTALTNPKAALLASMVARNPGIDQASLSEITGLPQSTVSFHLLRLHHCGALRSERTEGAHVKTYHPTNALQATLTRLREASLEPSHAAAVGAIA